ncbi:hypothetical protein ACFWVP_30560 [Streptomyces sp. NPDC058637]|uniref:hypothetical protein n=1 Tax=Streptomyces sp. NPDC058637 TaxID=3346569 RepID=UPI0036567B63
MVDIALAAVDVAATVFVMNDKFVGGGTTQEPLTTLCEDCDQRHEIDWEQTWPGATRQDPEQDSAWRARAEGCRLALAPAAEPDKPPRQPRFSFRHGASPANWMDTTEKARHAGSDDARGEA